MLDAKEARAISIGTAVADTVPQAARADQAARYRRIQLAVQQEVPKHLAAIDLAVRVQCERCALDATCRRETLYEVLATHEAVHAVTDAVVQQMEARGYTVRLAGHISTTEGEMDRMCAPLMLSW